MCLHSPGSSSASIPLPDLVLDRQRIRKNLQQGTPAAQDNRRQEGVEIEVLRPGPKYFLPKVTINFCILNSRLHIHRFTQASKTAAQGNQVLKQNKI
jgi:hypothetical protein